MNYQSRYTNFAEDKLGNPPITWNYMFYKVI
jgi:hypothetical protein